MARRVFFSFHYKRDVFRAWQVRNANVVAGTDMAGFFDHGEYQDAKGKGDDAIKRMILRHLENTTVTVVLLGRHTAARPWVRYEIAESIKRKNGLLGIYIHHLQDPNQREPASILGQMVPPAKPLVPPHVEFPAHMWNAKALPTFSRLIEEAGQRADALRKPPSRFSPVFPPRRFIS
jgi:hypothetical protein